MKTALHLAFVLGLSLLLSATAHAQFSYQWAIGAKVGNPPSISVKVFFNDASALETLGAFGWAGAGGTIFYEHHFYISAAPGLRFYLGGGGHAAFVPDYGYNPYANIYYDNGLYAGIDGIVGLEYVFEKIPLVLSLDVVPLLNIGSPASLWWNSGLSIRYAFK